MQIHRRTTLIASASILALTVGLSQQAQADTTAAVGVITPGASGATHILNTLTTTGGVATITNINSYDAVIGPSSGTATTTGSTNGILNLVGNNSTFNNNGNSLFALTRGNNASQSVGTNSSADGSVILNAQEVRPGAAAQLTTLAASTTGSINSSLLIGNGSNVTGNLNNNSVQARVSYNTAFSTIETTVPNTLNTVGVFQGYFATFVGNLVDPSSLSQLANYNTASVQANSGFGNPSVTGQAAATVDDTLITLSRVYATFGTATVSGTFRVNGNLVDASAVGNAADNGILLETGVASTFSGTAWSSSTQLSRETVAPGVGALPAISASNTDTIITANLFNILPGLAFLSAGDDLTARVNDNRISSSATINSSSNIVGFDSGLNLAGDSAAVGIAMAYGVSNNSLAAFSDFGVVNAQNAFAGLVATPQSASAETDDASVLFFIEGVADNTTITMNGNALAASAQGNVNTNLVLNHALGIDNDPGASLGNATTASVAGSFSSSNRQLVFRPDIEATMTDSEVQALIGTLNVGGTPFGGLVGGTVRLNDNSISALAGGNSATALIDLQGQSINTTHGNLITGATTAADREDATLAQVFTINPVSGLSIANLQFNAQTGGPAGSLLSTVRDNTIEAIVSWDDFTVEDWEIDNSTVTLNGNGFQAGSTVNSFAGVANLDAVNSFTGDAAVSNSQTVGGFGSIDITANLTGNEVNAVFGIANVSEGLTVRMQDNNLLALATGNDGTQRINVSAGSINGGTMQTSSSNNAVVLPSAVATQETLNTEVRAAGAFVLLSDQAINFSDFAATAAGNSLLVGLGTTTDALTSSLDNASLHVSGNGIVSQALGSTASNRIDIDADTSIGVTGSGAIGGIANSQTAAVVNAGDISLVANTNDNSIQVTVLDGSTAGGIENLILDVGDHVVDGVTLRNTISSNAFASSATNAVVASAGTSLGAVSTGVSLSVVNGAIDQTLGIDDSAFYVLNRQRNEGLNPTAVRGASLLAQTANNSVDVVVNGGTGGVDDSRLRIEGNAMQAVAIANVASNSVDTSAVTTSAVASGILNRQGNSGSVAGTNVSSSVGLTVTANDDDAVHDNLRAYVNNNAIEATATGNSVSNAISASAGTSLTGSNAAGASGAAIGTTVPANQLASIDTDSGSVDSNGNALVFGNLGLLNTQRNYGLAGNPSLIGSTLSDASVSLSVDSAVAQGVLSVQGNQAVSRATANAASNSVALQAGTSLSPVATVLNDQVASLTNVTAVTSGTNFGAINNGPITDVRSDVSGNVVMASASLNTASNSVTSNAGIANLPGATIVSHQETSGSSVSSSVSDTSITHVGLGVATSSVVAVNGNQIGSSATMNNSVNSIGAAGQVFTRTSSY